jgi:hypothetical protein
MAWAWPLHVATIAVWGGVMLTTLPHWGQKRRPAGMGYFAWWGKQHEESYDFMRRLLAVFPWPVRVLVIGAMPYAFVTFFLCLGLTEGGSPEEEHGRYYLKNHGRMIREISAEEYRRFEAYEVRLFSAGWVAIAVVGTAFLFYAMPRIDELAPAPRHQPPPLPG